MDLDPSPKKLRVIGNGLPSKEPDRVAAIEGRQQAARLEVVERWSRFTPSNNQFDKVFCNIDQK
jgi:hypothetical protein